MLKPNCFKFLFNITFIALLSLSVKAKSVNPVMDKSADCSMHLVQPMQSPVHEVDPRDLVVTTKDIEMAHERLNEYVDSPTDLIYSSELSNKYGMLIYLKMESSEPSPIGAFKWRGALNRLLQLTDQQKNQEIVTASSGNHAQGVAWATSLLGLSATVYMSVNTDKVKVEKTKAFGAKVVLHGEIFEEAKDLALEKVKEGGTFVHPYEDSAVIAGQGTIGLEIAEQLPDVDWVIGAIGGGGLMSGVAQALGPGVKSLGVQAENASPMLRSLSTHQEEASMENSQPTLAAGAAVYSASRAMTRSLRPHLYAVTAVSEDEVRDSVLDMHDLQQTAEGAGALPLAGLKKHFKEIKAHSDDPSEIKVVLIVSGKNIDKGKLAELRHQ